MSAPGKPKRVKAPHGYEPGECRRCKTPVFWATLVNAVGTVLRHPDRRAKRLPFDREPIQEGSAMLVDGGRGRARFLTPYEAKLRHDQTDPDPLYKPHVCPGRPRSRRRSR